GGPEGNCPGADGNGVGGAGELRKGSLEAEHHRPLGEHPRSEDLQDQPLLLHADDDLREADPLWFPHALAHAGTACTRPPIAWSCRRATASWGASRLARSSSGSVSPRTSATKWASCSARGSPASRTNGT